MKIKPQNEELQKHIDHYWIIKDSEELFQNKASIFAYPGISPELIIVLDGSLEFSYKKKRRATKNSVLENHIKENFILHPQSLKSFVFVRFKSKSLSSLMPFVNHAATELVKIDLCDANKILGSDFEKLCKHIALLDVEGIAAELDEWFYKRLNKSYNGYVTEIFEEIGYTNTLQEAKAISNLSYSTLERHFKKETGLTPKRFQTLKRYKGAVEEIYDTQNKDWIQYVFKYGYFDQSHFIKEVKRFTAFTPAQLLRLSSLRQYQNLSS